MSTQTFVVDSDDTDKTFSPLSGVLLFVSMIFIWNIPTLLLIARRFFVNDCRLFLQHAFRFFSRVFGPEHPVSVWQLIVFVQMITKIYPPQTTVCVDLYADRLHIGRIERLVCDLCQLQVQLVPTLVYTNRHRNHERTQLFDRVIVTHAQTSTNVFAVQNLFNCNNGVTFYNFNYFFIFVREF